MIHLSIQLPEYAIIIICISAIIMTVISLTLSIQRWKLVREQYRQEKRSRELNDKIIGHMRYVSVEGREAKIMKIQEKDGIPERDAKKVRH